MLLRAYRLTDKFGLVLLKSSAALTQWMLTGAAVALSASSAVASGVFGVFGSRVFGVVWRVLRSVGLLLWKVLSAIGGVILIVFNFFFRIVFGASGQARRSVGGAATSSMARRAARVEMEVGLAEDPLRAQNRALSGLIAVLLFVLIGLTWWATNPARGGNNPINSVAQIADGGASLLASTLEPTAVFLPSPVPTTTPLPDFLDVRGSLAYVVRENAQDDIWAVSVGGSRTPIRLTNDPADDRDPAWSPDGTQLAFSSRRDGNWDIYVLSLLTMETTRITFGLEYQGAPTWSPDGAYLAYESYQGSNLDIFAQPIDFSQPPVPITDNPSPDFSPAWIPEINGRSIAFVSWRDGNQDIYVVSLNDIANPVNITNTPTRSEDFPAWRGPEGDLLAYSALDGGQYLTFVQSPVPNVPAQVQPTTGQQPAWSPDGASIVVASDSPDGSTRLIANPFSESGTAALIVAEQLGASNPVWTSAPLPATLVNSGGVSGGFAEQLYIEQEREQQGLYGLGSLVGVETESPFLSDRVNDSFNAMRIEASERIGYDFLGSLEDALWSFVTNFRAPQLGEERLNWHYTGRAFAINRNLPLGGFPPPVEIVREDIGIYTYWRVYVRVADDAQSGQLGEPLRYMPWDFASRTQGDVQAYDQGGRVRSAMPAGYYVDLTQLALDYGWGRLPARSDWRANINAANYWMFVKTDGLTWLQAMLELYTEPQLGGFLPTSTPAPSPVAPTDEPGG